jgi:hypothetical protein
MHDASIFDKYLNITEAYILYVRLLLNEGNKII